MKICVPVTRPEGRETRLSTHFGRAPYFALVDTESGAIEFQENSGARQEHSGGGCPSADVAAATRPQAVLALGMGPGALGRLRAHDIRVYTVGSRQLGEAIAELSEGRAVEMDEVQAEAFHARHHAHSAGGHGRGRQ